MNYPNTLSIAFETNGKGFIGFVVELPGAFIRGKTEGEALSKINVEVNSYLRWLGDSKAHNFEFQVIQRHSSNLMVEDADNEILLDADREYLDEKEFKELLNLVHYSGVSFFSLYESSVFKDWIDESRIRKTFYGENPKTIREIFNHVNRTQYYYLSRVKLRFSEEETDFLKIREMCLLGFSKIFYESDNSLVYYIDRESWTLRKVLRRFIWHDRIHGKAITKILEKQKQRVMIREHIDPFYFLNSF
jgi:hypothetical protein